MSRMAEWKLRAASVVKGASALQVDRLLVDAATPARTIFNRAYRADAAIQLLSVTIYNRAGVGGGFASLEEMGTRNGRLVSLRFAAGSQPEQARGLNRLGFIHEVVREQDFTPREGGYFGFMTASPEEGIDQARKALEKSSAPTVPYAAVDGHTLAGRSVSRQTRLNVPSTYSWATRVPLQRDIRASFGESDVQIHDFPVQTRAGESPWTFLYSLRHAVLRGQERYEGDYVYNARQYHLRVDRGRDEKSARGFADRRIVQNASHVYRYTGQIREPRTGHTTNFRFWMEEGPESNLPVRIEFQPRSFLRLSFEYDPKLQPEPISPTATPERNTAA